ncbi:MAG TPA: PDZ domain-containing protein [Gemmatimonadales bacterium]|jgi:predicted metalloprotease with PDZ domain
MLPSFVALLLQAQAPVTYHLSFPNAAHHEAEIEATFRGVPPGPLELRMSRSSPGRYALAEFAKNVYGVTAVDGHGKPLTLTRPDPYGWTARGHDGTVVVRYTLFGDRPDGTYAGIDLTHARLNMPATFLWARGLAARPIRVTFDIPAGSSWKVATQLVPTDQPATFTAPNLNWFMDSPTELSDFALRTWTVGSGGNTYTMRLAVHHTGSDADLDGFTDMAKKVVAEEEAVFGEFPHYDHGTYTFIACYVPWGAGDGMEHRNSTFISSTRSLAENSMGLLGTLAHEYFHSWNMKRIRSKAIEPFDFERADMSDELWFGEGFTNYYGPLLIHRAGLTDEAEYIGAIGRTVNAVVNDPGRRYHSAVEMSELAPFVDAAVSIDPTNFQNTFISYYTYGEAIGLGLDLTLRTKFPGKTLDGYMRGVWLANGKPEKWYTMRDLQTVLGAYTGDSAFATDFFRRYIAGRDVVDYVALLAPAGALLRKAHPGEAWLGTLPGVGGGRGRGAGAPLVGTPAYDAGLDQGDQVNTLDGRPVTQPSDLQAVLAAHHPGDSVSVTFTQRGRERTATIKLVENPQLELVPFEAAGMTVTDEIRAFRASWLGKKGGN